MTSTALITTTINVPHLLMDYARDAISHGHCIKIVVTGDKKTPVQAADCCVQVSKETGIECEYMDVAAQNRFMRAYPALDAHLPWNCVQRRDVAILKAVADGAEVVVTIDDDNFLAAPNYFGGHACVGKEITLDTFGAKGQWFNICRFLSERSERRFFARGYGMAARALPEGEIPAACKQRKHVVVNAGLWLGDPDIDAATRLMNPVDVTGYTREENFFVREHAWTPFNSQNTAIAREALPAYFLSPYLGRHDDIFISFVLKRIADHFGHGVSFGHPLVRQDRNEHDLFHDLQLEWLGMKVTDALITALDEVSLTAPTYAESLLQVADQCALALREVPGVSMAHRTQLTAFFAGCRVWAQLPLWQQV